MIDLHSHTTASDGSFHPNELIDYALTKGLRALAITDHDTITGLLEARRYLEDLPSYNEAFELINGIELSTNIEGYPFDIHIVGLYLDLEQPGFLEELKRIVGDRNLRNIEMLRRINEHGYALTQNEVDDYAKGSVVTRAHFAGLLVQKGYFASNEEVFSVLLGNNRPCFVKREKVSSEFGIRFILKNGGIPIFAHPTLCPLDSNGLYALIDRLKSYGLVGIESFYTLYTKQQEEAMRHIAKRFSLLESGGSDFHGTNKPGNDLGSGYSRLSVPDSLLLPLQQWRKGQR